MNVIVNGEHVRIPEAQKELLSVFVPSPQIHNIRYEGRVPLTIEVTTYHAERVKTLHPLTKQLVDKVLNDWQSDMRKYGSRQRQGWHSLFLNGCLKNAGTGGCHVVGLIDLILKLQDLKTPIAVVHPEAGLHPSIVGPLTDVLIELAYRGADPELQFEMLARKAEIK